MIAILNVMINFKKKSVEKSQQEKTLPLKANI